MYKRNSPSHALWWAFRNSSRTFLREEGAYTGSAVATCHLQVAKLEWLKNVLGTIIR